jgi:hypothetical protein
LVRSVSADEMISKLCWLFVLCCLGSVSLAMVVVYKIFVHNHREYWLLDQGTRPNQIALVGDSAGGGLVLALEVWPGIFHVWQLTSRAIPEARQAIERIGVFLWSRFAEAV